MRTASTTRRQSVRSTARSRATSTYGDSVYENNTAENSILQADADVPETVAPTKTKNKISAIRSRQNEREKQKALLAEMSPNIAGRRAAVWVGEWDRGSRTVRLRILEALTTLHSSSNTNRLEKDLGDSSMLLFTRITAWFRLTCKLGFTLQPLLSAISLFIRGVRYLTSLMEIGGAQTLIDTLGTCNLAREDRREIALLLLYIANAGRVYREMLCDDEDIHLLIQALQREDDAEILELLAALFLVLGEGNKQSVTFRLHTELLGLILSKTSTVESKLQAARILRTFQSSRDKEYSQAIGRDALEDKGMVPILGIVPGSSSDGVQQLLLEALYSLLLHDDLRLRVEGTELLTMVAKNIQFTAAILTRCLDVVDEDRLAIEAEDDHRAAMIIRRHQISFGSTAVNIILLDSRCEALQRLVLDIIGRRSAHFTLLKYLRLLENMNPTLVLDCCRVLQMLCRGALLQERHATESGDSLSFSSSSSLAADATTTTAATTAPVSLEKVAKHIREAVGSTLYSVLLYEELTEDEAASIARSVTSSASRM
ncbi:uncharacterized protein TM35_000054130 [Trypanosoma theileri]|uniref:Uncharacterized protein n=1 Tax=Trypanosoma theileri TaxID=67003 RepID=A0A1X0P4F4_9TRYP|nr:uncharacterized protein TM35_000054130 [Trypanosoma theileri]ORC91817.1 hypothetical protein TM35_000054130 [Trypanosoma theileri]